MKHIAAPTHTQAHTASGLEWPTVDQLIDRIVRGILDPTQPVWSGRLPSRPARPTYTPYRDRLHVAPGGVERRIVAPPTAHMHDAPVGWLRGWRSS